MNCTRTASAADCIWQRAWQLNLQPDQLVLDPGCGKDPASIFLIQRYGVKAIAVDLWTSVTFLNQKFSQRGYRGRFFGLSNLMGQLVGVGGSALAVAILGVLSL